jgi:endonuclease/exonuclease/phosphatase family metal-dependent hydrolase
VPVARQLADSDPLGPPPRARRLTELTAGLRDFARRRRAPITVLGSLATAAILAFLLAGRRQEFAAALSSGATAWVLGVTVLLQIVALLFRSEAWHLCIEAGGGTVERRILYRASSMQVLGSLLNSQAGVAARIAALRRSSPSVSPQVPTLIAAEFPIFAVEGSLAALTSFTLLEGLAAVINGQTPEALGLQEIGDPDALGDLVDRLDGEWHRQVSQHPDQRGIRVAWLSRRPIDDSADIEAFPAHLQPVQADDEGASEGAIGRGAVAISVKSESGRVVQLVTAHLKSKLLTFPGGRFVPHDEDERARFAAYALFRRAGEAATLRVWATGALDAHGEERALVLCGDLNDTPEAATTQLLLGPPGSEIGTGGLEHPDQGDRQRLWNLAPLMPEGRDYSRINHGRRELIDHILVSAALVRKADSVEAVIEEPLPSVSADPIARRDQSSSDHAPVVASFEI